MRLEVLNSGQSLIQKSLRFVINKALGFVPGPISMMSYKKKFFGKNFAYLIDGGMREAKHWEVVDLEIMGAFISHRNSCRICLSDHTAIVTQVLEPATMELVLKDHHAAPISAKLKVSLDLLEKLTLTPNRLLAEDFIPLKKQGLSHSAIEEVMLVALVFCSINRIGDALGFELAPKPEKVGKFLYKRGYKLGSLPG